jgi:hypothetical protein
LSPCTSLPVSIKRLHSYISNMNIHTSYASYANEEYMPTESSRLEVCTLEVTTSSSLSWYASCFCLVSSWDLSLLM